MHNAIIFKIYNPVLVQQRFFVWKIFYIDSFIVCFGQDKRCNNLFAFLAQFDISRTINPLIFEFCGTDRFLFIVDSYVLC